MALSDLIQSAAGSTNGVVPAGLLAGLVQVESSNNPNAIGSAGEIGYTQLLPSTAYQLGVNPYDPAQNLQGGAQYLAQLIRQNGGNVSAGLAQYNGDTPGSSAGAAYSQKVLNAAAQNGYGNATQSGSQSGAQTSPWLYIAAIVIIIALVLFGVWGVTKG